MAVNIELFFVFKEKKKQKTIKNPIQLYFPFSLKLHPQFKMLNYFHMKYLLNEKFTQYHITQVEEKF